MDLDAIRERIRQAMGDMRPADLSRRSGERPGNISRYLRDREPSISFLVAVCEALDVDAHWLLFGVGPMRPGAVDWSQVTFDQLLGESMRRIQHMHANVGRVMREIGLADAGPEGPH